MRSALPALRVALALCGSVLSVLAGPAARADDDAALLREVASRPCAEAAPRLRERLRDHRGAGAPPALGRRLLACLDQAQDYDAMAEVVADLRGPAEAPRATGDFGAELAQIDLALRRRAAEELLRQGDHERAGAAFAALARSAPERRLRFEAAYNAAVAFTVLRRPGAAQGALQLALQSAPDPADARRVLQRLAPAYLVTADFAAAAAAYEALGRRAAPLGPGQDREGMEALYNAAMLRGALGQVAALRADARLFAQRFGGPRATEPAAGLFLELAAHQPAAQVRDHLREYLRLFAQAGGRQRALTARAHLGRIALDASCPGAEDGLCLARAPLPPAAVARLGCGPAGRSRIDVRQRDAALLREAEGHLRGALAMTRGGAGGPDDRHEAELAAAVTVALADLEFERLLAAPPPAELPIAAAPRERQAGLQAAARWLGQLLPRFAAVERRYQAALDLRHPAWTLAALARLGQLQAALTNRLVTLPLTPPSADPRLQRAYCAALDDVIRPSQERAAEAFTACLARAAEQGIASPWSSLCERELHRLDPRRYPLPGELQAGPRPGPLALERAPIAP